MIERDLVIDYELVRGLPYVVEARVKELIKDGSNGWQPKGKPSLMKVDGYEILIQCMVKTK